MKPPSTKWPNPSLHLKFNSWLSPRSRAAEFKRHKAFWVRLPPHIERIP